MWLVQYVRYLEHLMILFERNLLVDIRLRVMRTGMLCLAVNIVLAVRNYLAVRLGLAVRLVLAVRLGLAVRLIWNNLFMIKRVELLSGYGLMMRA